MTEHEMNERIQALCEAKGLRFRPWEVEPWDCDDGASPWPPGTTGFDSWGKAQQLRRRLIAEITKRGDHDE